MAQNVIYGRDHNVLAGSGVLNINNITTADPYPHLKSLYDAVAGVGASHTSEQQYTRGTCLQGTREDALGDIYSWSSDETSPPVCWLSGTAGVGKSAIAMTIAKSLENDGLVASFFFFRPDPKRNNPSALMPTIALGLASKTSSLRTFIDRRVTRDPTILDASLEDQFRELVLKPSMQTKQSGLEENPVQKVPNLVIIDGLDECGDEDTQERILTTILSSYQQPPSTRPPLKFLICSRPEAWIRESFGTEDFRELTHHIMLDAASRDIARYLRHEFDKIRTTPKYSRLPFPSPWPSEWELSRLVHKSSSQFVYAATAAKFVKTPYSNPLDQLHILLGYTTRNQPSTSLFPELDRLYHIILSVNPNREKLLLILAAVFVTVPYLPPSPESIEILLDLTPGEVDLTLRAMHSVLDIRGPWDEIKVFHTSFRDFLLDRSRSGIYFIDHPAQTQFIARRWLQLLSAERLRRDGFHQIFKEERVSQALLADLRNVELSVVLLCRREMVWDTIFSGLVTWLQKSNAYDIDRDIIDRFKSRPKHFHLETSTDLYKSEEHQAAYVAFEHAAILAINGYEDWYSLHFAQTWILDHHLPLTRTMKRPVREQ
ncbi:hypothetical protein PQX77_019253 [Marasmius sp. AFHP31]|nr:hypothetical protein PQX77_019253 [Marasmius sp. AFHP31]